MADAEQSVEDSFKGKIGPQLFIGKLKRGFAETLCPECDVPVSKFFGVSLSNGKLRQ